jgi:hypothetical protein
MTYPLSRRVRCALAPFVFGVAALAQDLPQVASADLFDTGVRGQSVLRLRFATPPRGTSLTVYPYDRPTLLRDDGRAPDTRAGDGEFAAAVATDFATEAALFDANRADMVRMGRLPVVVERELQGWIAGTELPQRTKSQLPIFPMRRLRTLIDPARSLMITATSVVESPGHTWNPCAQTGNAAGIWTFKHLMTQMCNQSTTGIDPADFVEQWLNTWSTAQTINTFNVPARLAVSEILTTWPRDGNNKLILDEAPFKLQAIVNRIDLRVGGFYGGGTAGELRFVFALVDCADSEAEPFLVIFEYKVPIGGCTNVKAWGQQWADLSTHTLGSTNYLNALAAITVQVTEANLAPTRPNGSALGQLRTNEFLDNSDWELREFTLPTGNGHLTPSTVAMTPDASFENGAPEISLGAWLDTRPPGPAIPLSVAGIGPMRGGNSQPIGPNWHWNPPTSVDRRFKFSLNTCNGCHAGETQTFVNGPGFRHIAEAFFGSEAGLSAFLIGDPANVADSFWHDVPDPVNGPLEHLFFDLEVRRLHLDALLASSCLGDVVFQALRSPH